MKRLLLQLVALSLLVAQAAAAPKARTVTVNPPAGTGSNTQSVSAINPVAGILAFGQTPVAGQNGLYFGVGMTDCTNQRGRNWFSPDNASSPAWTSTLKTDRRWYIFDGSNEWASAITSCGVNEYIEHWHATSGSTPQIQQIAVGDTADTFVGSFTTGATGAGTQNVTGVGFTPTAAIFQPFWWVNLGFTDGTNHFAISYRTETTNPTISKAKQTTTYSIQAFDTSDTIVLEGSVTAWGADGFTVTWVTNNQNVTVPFMAFTGINAKVGTFNQPTSNGTQQVTGLNQNPLAIVFASYGHASSASVQADVEIMIGTTDFELSNQSQTYLSKDNIDPSNTANTFDATHAIEFRDATAGALSSEGEVTAIGSSGTFTVNWTTTDATARQIGYLSLGDTAGGTPGTDGQGALGLMGIGK